MPQLKSVDITNIRGIEHAQFRAGAITAVRGPNGSGKSSLLAGVKDPFEGGHDPSMIRQGAKKGEIRLTLDDGTTIEKTITPKSATTVVKNAAGEVIPAPATYIATLAKGFAFDPLAFVAASHKERADYLSKVMPVAITRLQIVASCDQKRMAPLVARLITGEQFDIGSLNLLRKRIYDDRAAVNKSIKIQEGGIDALRKTLPGDWKPEGDADTVAREALDALEEKTEKLRTIKGLRDKTVAEFDKFLASELTEVSNWEASEIDRIRVEGANRRTVIHAEGKTERHRIEHSLDAEMESAHEAVTVASAQVSVAREKARHFAQQAQAAATIAQYQQDLKGAMGEEDVYTAAIEAIDAAKKKALRSMPIPGLSTQDGEVMYQPEGMEAPIPFDAVNTQRQYELALRIAAQGAGELGLMVIDNTEALDTQHWEDFKAACVASGFQVIAARVDDAQELDIEPIGVAGAG
jgi:hypothetical protein